MSWSSDDVPTEVDSIRRLEGEVRIASRIIDYLSSGLYATPGACLKELVNNSYDADATHVRLSVKPSAFTVTLQDDGTGLTPEQFETHFRKIAESRKRDATDKTERGRKKIGKIGIGFIAANELCDRMRIESSVAGSNELLDVTLDFEAMRNDHGSRRDEDGTIHKGDYRGHVFETDAARHFTRVTLFDLKPDAKNTLIRSEPEEQQSRTLESAYGLAPDSVRDVLADLATWSDLDLYSRTMLQVALNVPVAYPGRWLATNIAEPEASLKKIQTTFAKRADTLGFRVTYDGTDLRKPIILKAQRKSCVAKELRHQGAHVSYTGYLFASHGTIAPKELQGVLVRVREAAIGEYAQDLLDFPQSRFSLLQRWVSAEIYASDELEDAMNIDRSTLRVTHPAYVELRQSFHGYLADFLSEVREVLYQQPAAAKRKAEAKDASKRITDRLRKGDGPGGTKPRAKAHDTGHEKAAKRVEEQSRIDPAAFTRKLSAAELFEIVASVADEVLPPDQAGRFLEALASEIFRRGRAGR